jgi:hypothetical protein
MTFKERLQEYRSKSDAIYRKAAMEAEAFERAPKPPVYRDRGDNGPDRRNRPNRSSRAKLGDNPKLRAALDAFRERFAERGEGDANRWRALAREQQVRIANTAPKSSARATEVDLYHQITEMIRTLEGRS